MFEIFLYFIISLVLLELEYLYFKIARRFNIIDRPNERSSHNIITLRGGGVIIPVATLLYIFISKNEYYYFAAGLLFISFISFWDDVKSISSIIRFFIHIFSVTLMLFQVDAFSFQPWIITIIYLILIGAINAYNFMDGINGITGLYSLTTILSLLFINYYENFIEFNFLIILILSIVVFLFFNFRKKAMCFAGDVGSISLAFIIVFVLSLLILKTHFFLYVLFLAVYGVDTFLTIIYRLFNKENIFKAHRSHAYQLLSNEVKIPHLWVSITYALLQLIINIIIIIISRLSLTVPFKVFIVTIILSILSFLYVLAHRHTNKTLYR